MDFRGHDKLEYPVGEPDCPHVDEFLVRRIETTELRERVRTDVLNGLLNCRRFLHSMEQERDRVCHTDIAMLQPKGQVGREEKEELFWP